MVRETGSAASLRPGEGLSGRSLERISEPFGPFLEHFVGETWRAEGEVLVCPREGPAEALLITDPSGPVAAVFGRSAGPVRTLAKLRPRIPKFSEAELDGPSETFDLFRSRIAASPAPPRFRHAIGLAGPGDSEEVIALWTSAFGRVDERWFRGLEAAGERVFAARVDGRVVGAAALQLVPGHARLHSLVVAPGYRDLGIGSDLVRARLWWAGRAGAVEAIAEIARANAASRMTAERAGLRSDGSIHFYGGEEPEAPR